MSKVHVFWHRARFAALLAPAFLGGCYVVPIVPQPQPRPYYRHHHYRGDYRVGQLQAPLAQDRQADAAVDLSSAPI